MWEIFPLQMQKKAEFRYEKFDKNRRVKEAEVALEAGAED